MKYAGMILLLMGLEQEERMDKAYDSRVGEVLRREEQERRDAEYEDDQRKSVRNVLKFLRKKIGEGQGESEEEMKDAMEEVENQSRVVDLFEKKEKEGLSDDQFVAAIEALELGNDDDTMKNTNNVEKMSFANDTNQEEEKEDSGDNLDGFSSGLMEFLVSGTNNSDLNIQDLTLEKVIPRAAVSATPPSTPTPTVA